MEENALSFSPPILTFHPPSFHHFHHPHTYPKEAISQINQYQFIRGVPKGDSPVPWLLAVSIPSTFWPTAKSKKSLNSPVPKVLGQSGKPHEPAALWGWSSFCHRVSPGHSSLTPWNQNKGRSAALFHMSTHSVVEVAALMISGLNCIWGSSFVIKDSAY